MTGNCHLGTSSLLHLMICSLGEEKPRWGGIGPLLQGGTLRPMARYPGISLTQLTAHGPVFQHSVMEVNLNPEALGHPHKCSEQGIWTVTPSTPCGCRKTRGQQKAVASWVLQFRDVQTLGASNYEVACCGHAAS